ncbi:MAG: hypothetical protein COZ06_29595 [Armatimonadetes bacterium CG_4_10_14_3_um_filter_66_18]|nr:sigma-70 family RNA polymerase sigma factor [Armatimonadota bacterium]OIO99097.1 MAG: hypothetical protein AUJ96_20080 [Armatimonadetes bacterium CG2_30_66_41]PIU92818.1 MAG: hypothetical protein COS65_15980 [Armatimonadetes bacterium CG06_land_8_20_14_3_00_66_21]PIW19267.1 MAG: hypothetical protein COW34_03890 [Armatimonadetes bacterium CG17_big_fil_post_rev_8_21_14_2_50_66_6]PIX46356.1 MAG: hypothetical protein COZ57_12465 [Armatimonadetes bacterium CG_4_8_14_3_um_filter_66_20]PIY39441.1 
MAEAQTTAPLPSDQELVAATQAGDRGAFEGLVSRHRAGVYGLALHLLRDPDEADEAAQEAFVRAYQLLDRYDSKREFSPWLRGIAAKVCLESQRRWRRMSQMEELSDELVGTGGIGAREDALVVREALHTLPDQYRIPLLMFYLDDASVIDVAYALGLSLGAVRVRLQRGRELLRKKLSCMVETEVSRDGLPEGATAC